MAIKNQCTFIGRLGDNPELKSFGENKNLLTFSLAVNDKFVNKNTGEVVEETTWINAVCFREGLIKYINKTAQKGTLVLLSCKYNVNSYEVEGEKKKSHQFIVEEYTPFDNLKKVEKEEKDVDVPF